MKKQLLLLLTLVALFGGSYASANDGVHNWEIASTNMPIIVMQNVVSTATVNIRNLGSQEEAAGSYTATLYLDDEAIATAESVALPVNQPTDDGTELSFNFRYPKVGFFHLYIELKAGDYSVQTDSYYVEFEKETKTEEATAEASGFSEDVPLKLYFNNSESVSLYTPEVLGNSYGLRSGDKIKAITYKGYKSSSNHTSTLKVWYEWVDDGEQTRPNGGLYDTDDMLKIIEDQEKTWEKKGTSSKLEDFITLDFSDEPLEYKGKALRIVVRSEANAYAHVYFEVSRTSGLAYYHFKDESSGFTSTTSSWSGSYLPVLHLTLDVPVTTISGIVRYSDDKPVEGATVTLISEDGDNVQYTGTTNASGIYRIEVIQDQRTYTVIASKDGAEARQTGVYGNNLLTPCDFTLPYTNDVTLADNTEDATHWTITPTKTSEGKTVTLNYSGTKEVASVTAKAALLTRGENITVYFTDAQNYGNVHIYYWDNGGDWPGKAMDPVEINDYGQQVYKAVIPADVDGINFNNGNNNQQTVDITEGITDGAWWYTKSEKEENKNKVGSAGTYTTPITVTPTANANEWTFEMPDGNVEVDVKYRTYYVVGTMTDLAWTINTDYQLQPVTAGEYYINDRTLNKDKEFKVVSSIDGGASIENWYPGGDAGNFIVPSDATYIICFRPDGQGGDNWHYGYIYLQENTCTVNFAPEGFATYYYSLFDVTLPEGVKARVVTDKGNAAGTLTYETIADGDTEGKVVPAGTAIMLQTEKSNEAQQKTLALSVKTAAVYEGSNYLRGSDVDATTSGEGLHYKLTYGNDGNNFGWYWGEEDGAAFTSPAHKAWLVLPTSAARSFFGLPDEATTGVASMSEVRSLKSDVWYDLLGRQLDKQPTQKGVYIIGGRKHVIK